MHIFQFTAPANRFARMTLCRQIDRVGGLRAKMTGEAHFRPVPVGGSPVDGHDVPTGKLFEADVVWQEAAGCS